MTHDYWRIHQLLMTCSMIDGLILLLIECRIDSFRDSLFPWSLSIVFYGWLMFLFHWLIDWSLNWLIDWIDNKQMPLSFMEKLTTTTGQRPSHRWTVERHAASQESILSPSDCDRDFVITVVTVISKRNITWHSEAFNIIIRRRLLRHRRLYHIFSPCSINSGQADLWLLAGDPLALGNDTRLDGEGQGPMSVCRVKQQ